MLAGEQRVDRVVEVVVPVGIETPAAARALAHHHGIVRVVLADQHERPAEPLLERVDLVDQLGHEVGLAVVVQRVNRVEPQPVGAEVG